MRKTEDMRGENNVVVTVTSNSQQTYLDNRKGPSKHAVTTLLMPCMHKVMPHLILLIVASMIYFSISTLPAKQWGRNPRYLAKKLG